jgi:hypothetical protein
MQPENLGYGLTPALKQRAGTTGPTAMGAYSASFLPIAALGSKAVQGPTLSLHWERNPLPKAPGATSDPAPFYIPALHPRFILESGFPPRPGRGKHDAAAGGFADQMLWIASPQALKRQATLR